MLQDVISLDKSIKQINENVKKNNFHHHQKIFTLSLSKIVLDFNNTIYKIVNYQTGIKIKYLQKLFDLSGLSDIFLPYKVFYWGENIIILTQEKLQEVQINSKTVPSINLLENYSIFNNELSFSFERQKYINYLFYRDYPENFIKLCDFIQEIGITDIHPKNIGTNKDDIHKIFDWDLIIPTPSKSQLFCDKYNITEKDKELFESIKELLHGKI